MMVNGLKLPTNTPVLIFAGKVTHFFSLSWLSALKTFFRKVFKEIVFQNGAYFLQQSGADVFTTEDVVDVSPFTINFSGKPGYWSVSLFEHFLDFLSDVHNY